MEKIEPNIKNIYNKLIKQKYSHNKIVIYFFLKHYINITTYDFYKKEGNEIKDIYNGLIKQKYSYKYIVGYFLVKHYISPFSLNYICDNKILIEYT